MGYIDLNIPLIPIFLCPFCRLEALLQKSKQMSDPELQGEEQKYQQEAPDDTETAPGATGRQRQAPDKRQPGATVGHRLAALGHRRAVA